MPSIADLNVRLGLIYKDLDKGLEGVERKLRSSGRRLSDLGDQMTVALSLPLAAAGAAAVKTAGDIESLQLALESQLGSTEAARKELELLRQEALKPGLGFEQAVRGSVSLQAVGFAADKARKIISEFGNGLALAGKGAQELDGVILALTQIQSKGIVSAEEINQIAERLPQIRTLMQAAFGTASSEAIQKLGISSQQFIEGITAQLEKLPRATGGIKNSLENFFDAIKLGAAKFGEAISKALDLPATLDKISSGLSSVAESFSNLDAGTQKTIVQFGLFAVATGPLVKVFGAVKGGAAQMIDVLQGAGGILKSTGSAVLGLTDSVNRLKLAFGIVGVVVAVGAAVYALADRFDAAAYAQEQFEAGQRAVIESTAKEVAAVNQNFEALKKEGISRVEKGKIIDQLLAQYPIYLRGIDLENASVSALTKVQKGLNDQILRGVAERQKAAAVTALYEKQAQILLRIQQIRDGAEVTISEAALINTGDMVRAGSIAAAVILKMQQQAADLGTQVTVTSEQFDKAFGTMSRAIDPALQKEYDARDAYYADREIIEDLAKTKVKLVENTKKEAKAIKEVKTELDAYLESLQKQESLQNKIRQAAASMGLAPLESLPQAGTGPVESIKPPAGPEFSTFAAGLTTALTPAEALLDALNSKLFTFNELFALTSEGVAANGTVMQQAILAAASAMSEAAASGASSLGALASAAVGSAAKIVRAWIQQGVAAAVAKALSGLPFPFNIAAGAAAGALAAGAFNKVLNAIKVPGFAQGTNFAPGGMALVGERGPELVSLPRGSQVTPNNRLSGMMGGSNVTVGGTFRISGTDLLVVLEKAQSQQRRVRGY